MRISDWSSDVALPICYRVVLAGRSAEKVEASAAEIQADGGQARALVGDASPEEDAATFAAAAEAWAPLAVAVHNAGTNRRDYFLDLEVAHFDQLWRAHKIGRAHVCTQVTNEHLVCCRMLEKQHTRHIYTLT